MSTRALRLSAQLMLARGAMKVARAWNLPFREHAYRAWYDAINDFSGLVFADFQCMNYGYAPAAATAAAERFQLALYDFLAHLRGPGTLQAARVLEVGSGRGGGAAHLRRLYDTGAVVGVDLSRRAIEASCARHSADGLRFAVGNSENLPFADRCFDVVLNVESSHCYPDPSAFLRETQRVLTSDGVLLLADFRHATEVKLLDEQIAGAQFEVLERHDITGRIVAALEADDARKRAMIDSLPAVPAPVRASIRHFAGCLGSPMCEDFQNRRRVYLAYALRPK